jgi:hypothetical protein
MKDIRHPKKPLNHRLPGTRRPGRIHCEDATGHLLAYLRKEKNKCTYLLTYLLTHSVVQDIIWKAHCPSACQKISCFLMEYRVHTSPSLDTILSQPNPVRPIDSYLPKVHLNVILPPTPRSHWFTKLIILKPNFVTRWWWWWWWWWWRIQGRMQYGIKFINRKQ